LRFAILAAIALPLFLAGAFYLDYSHGAALRSQSHSHHCHPERSESFA
jgi:hypothetical protein